MEFRKLLALRGPNIWANFPVLEVWVDLGELKDKASNEIPGFNDRLMSWLPSMIEHRCSIGERGGFFQRLRNGTYPAHILEHITLELQSLAGTDVGFGKARETSEEGVFRVIVEYVEETVGRECLAAARELFLAAVYDRPFDVAGCVARLRDLTQEVSLGPSTRAIVEAARARGIPARRMNANSLVVLGHGRKQRRIQAAETDRTGAIAESIAQDKELTREFLLAAGVPVPNGRAVADAEDAWRAARELGAPVVVKPRDGNQGRGVATNLTTREQVISAYEAASQESGSVLVEKYAPGHDYRLLVVGDRVAAAARREPAQVLGDGEHTINQLIERANADPRRGDHHATVLSKLKLDAVSLAVLAEQGFTPESVPSAGTTVLIRRNGNLSTGGTAIDVTERVHPAVAAKALDAARTVGLDIAGIDMLAHDISRPLEEQGGAVVEVNAAPGLRMHLEPSAGIARPVGEAIVDLLFPPGEDGRAPIVAVTGVNGKTTTTRFIAHIIRGEGKCVGMTCTDGIFVDDQRLDYADCSGPQSARSVLLNPNVEAAVFETARGGILREGLAFDYCDVAVVTNIGEGDHLGLCDVNTPEELAKVKRCIVEAVAPDGYAVLNAADPLVAAMAAHCPGGTVFFALDPRSSVIERHRALGGKAAFVRDRHIIVAEGEREETVVSLDRLPLSRGGQVSFQVENSLAAIAAAWSLGVPMEVISARTTSFAADIDRVPARFNVLEIDGATVVVDYGHNAHSLSAVIEAIGRFPHLRRACVYSTAGDRRDCDIVRQGELLGAAFDRVVLYEDHYLRGRASGEIIGLLRRGLNSAARAKEVVEVLGATRAAEIALDSTAPGELLLLQADTVDETIRWLRDYLATRAEKKANGAVLREAGEPLASADIESPVLAEVNAAKI
ncbi:MAG: cyanophycin synthetase [Pirellulales bacterium]|nr:cyanophycin synthetase [Pirellulales bacterium]